VLSDQARIDTKPDWERSWDRCTAFPRAATVIRLQHDQLFLLLQEPAGDAATPQRLLKRGIFQECSLISPPLLPLAALPSAFLAEV